MENLLSETASQRLVEGVLELAKVMALKEIEHQNMKPLKQKDLMKLYNFDHKYMTKLKALGLKGRKQGKSIYYDVRDVDAFLETLKTY